MKKNIYILALGAALSILSSCNKKDNASSCDVRVEQVSANNAEILKNLIDEHHPNAVYHTDGFYYEIVAEGTGKQPNACSPVTVNYQGTLTNGTVFDKSNNIQFGLNDLISGWRVGLPLIKSGGIIILYLPPELAYGANGVSNLIPGNAITIFNIELLQVN